MAHGRYSTNADHSFSHLLMHSKKSSLKEKLHSKENGKHNPLSIVLTKTLAMESKDERLMITISN